LLTKGGVAKYTYIPNLIRMGMCVRVRSRPT